MTDDFNILAADGGVAATYYRGHNTRDWYKRAIAELVQLDIPKDVVIELSHHAGDTREGPEGVPPIHFDHLGYTVTLTRNDHEYGYSRVLAWHEVYGENAKPHALGQWVWFDINHIRRTMEGNPDA